MAKLFFFIFFCHVLWLPQARAEAPMHITEADMQVIPGQGHALPPASFDPATLPGPWIHVQLPHTLPRELLPSVRHDASLPATEVVWYRIKLAPMIATADLHYLYLPRLQTSGQVSIYADALLLYQAHASRLWNGWNIPAWIALHETADTRLPREIYVRIDRARNVGGGISSVWFGGDEAIGWRYRLRYLLQVQLPYASSAAFLAVGLFALMVWYRLRSHYIYMLLFFISAAAFLRSLHYYVGEDRLPIPDNWFTWITINSVFWMVLVTHFFLNHLHSRPKLRWNYLISGIIVVVAIATAPPLASWIMTNSLSPLAYLLLIITGSTVAINGFVQSWRSRSHDGLVLSSWAMLGIPLGCYDWLLQNYHVSIESLYLGPYSNVSAFLVFMYIIFLRYIVANENVVQFNTRLQKRLLSQEAELDEYHQRLRTSAQRQVLDDERARLMQDMHDGMGSSLITALLAVKEGKANASMVADILKDCIDDLKLTIDSMESVQADLLLLMATLRFRLAPRLEEAGIKLRWEVTDVPPLEWLDPRNTLHILRIFQEAFSNIIKHAQATEIRMTTLRDGDNVLVVISDNGCGFSVEKGLQTKGKGLNNQLRRAASIGTTVTWHSDQHGTRMTLTLPIVHKRSTSKLN
ncbi:sensor histidine kinase [Janthinobacterium sp. PC23-8]|uniref:sensor histidine kinase n=1 Tax=Janthinobacterium sp. PC23-8 TaxID=2012679 RepID=UPI000B97672A|nr:sensor histidine kinase [Janthinobacterium sp. PC23-8]OYO27924.1 hypothetical protein CD932_22715 [Janthinobacterium sp. PC23-8]